MYIPKKEQIIKLLLKLENDIEFDHRKWIVHDDKLPSLYLWSKHVEYIREIISLFEKDNEIENLVKIYDVLKIDKFNVEASTSYYESVCVLKDYIKKTKEILSL